MNKKGFTLVELLATIVIIAVIMGIVLPSAIRVSQENQGKMLDEYKKIIEEYALLYSPRGQEIIDINDLDVPEKIKSECTGHAQRVSEKPLEYKAEIECNITGNL